MLGNNRKASTCVPGLEVWSRDLRIELLVLGDSSDSAKNMRFERFRAVACKSACFERFEKHNRFGNAI